MQNPQPLRQLGVEADIAADRAHVAQDWRGHGGGCFRENWIVLAQEFGALDGANRSQSANLNAAIGLWPDTTKIGDPAEVEDMFRLENLLPHGRN